MFLLACLAAWQATRLRIGQWNQPGPGFFPFYLALILGVVSLALLWHAAVRKKESPPSGEAVPPPRGRGKVLWTMGALGAYAFALEPAGFLLATFFFLLFLYRVVEPRRWPAALGGSLAATGLTYALFYLLRVRLPSGLWMP